MSDTIRATDTCAAIEQRIREARAKQNRMPLHWVERRAEVGDVIDALVDQWMAARTCRTCGRTKASCDAEVGHCCVVCRETGYG